MSHEIVTMICIQCSYEWTACAVDGGMAINLGSDAMRATIYNPDVCELCGHKGRVKAVQGVTG